MGIDITRQNLPVVMVWFVFMFGLFLAASLSTAAELPVELQGVMPLHRTAALFAYNNIALFYIAAFLLVFINSFYISRIITRNIIFLERTFMPTLIYLIASLGYVFDVWSLGMLVAGLFVMAAADNIISSYRREGRARYFFNASFYCGVAALIYAPALLLWVWIAVSLMLFRREWREWVASLVFFVPVFAASYIEWAMGGDFLSLPHRITETFTNVTLRDIGAGWGAWEYLLLSVTVALTVLSLFTFFTERHRLRKRANVAQSSFIWLLVTVCIMEVFSPHGITIMPLAAVPLAAVVPGFFNGKTGLGRNIAYAAAITVIMVYNISKLV